MEYMNTLKDSVETSVKIGIFSSEETASRAHIFKSTFTLLDKSLWKDLQNFNPNRLSNTPYKNKPRGENNMKSVNYHKKQIQQYGQTSPIWVAKDGETLTLLDGAHRLVATYLAGKSEIPAFIVEQS
jgi:hypothetical protein